MSKNSIQVCIKVRPLLMPKERDMFSMWHVKDNSIHMVETQTEPYFFDYIFDQDASNEIIFEKMAKQIVHACVQGFNGTIFAYGQTSSGKTYTMMGDDKNPGVMVLAAKEIFQQIEEHADRQFLLRVGYIEIYNEKIYDLLNKKNQDLKIHEALNGIVHLNCEEKIITSEKELIRYLCIGNKERTVGETNMNERSSRSHAIFRIIIESRKTDRSEEDAVIQSVLNLVDLAGSERADQTGATGARLKEGGHINKSLLFLSNVIKHLSENADSKYISYRDSKLTRILQASLGGNALTSIICTIKPTTVEETQSTLNFAMRAKVIKNKPQLNEIVTDATMMKRLEREIKSLKVQLDEERRKNASQIKVGQLEKRIQADMLKIISGNSIYNMRLQSDKRRRTWCPALSTEEESQSMIVPPSSLPMPTSGSNRSQLPKPSFSFMNVSTRDFAPKTISVFKTLDVTVEEPDDNDFSPAEEHDFNKVPTGFHTPKALAVGNRLPTVSITPTLNEQPGKNLEVVEKELLELQKYTNLEKQINVQHEQYASLKNKFDIVSSERDKLKSERLSYMQVKDELDDTKQNYQKSEKRCDILQIQISKLTNSNQLANDKISQYEADLETLKLSNAALKKDNREVVNLEVEFEQYKKKSAQRIDDLLSALSEKDSEIAKLEESLRVIAVQSLHNSKEEQFQSSMLENGNSNSNYTSNGNGHQQSTEIIEGICMKCDDLERLREENIKVSADFEKLTVEYEKLKESYNEMSTNALAAQAKLQELKLLTSADSAECEELRSEIVTIRAKLVDLQLAYEQMNCDRNVKSDTCEKLNSILERARDDMQQLQTKYDNLELVLVEKDQTIKEIQAEYIAIQLKYDNLQIEYDKMEENTISSFENCQRLQSENTSLLSEIGVLKARVEEEQRKLLALEAEKQQLPEVCAQLDDLRQKNATLIENLEMKQLQFNELQKEYNDLSNQLMDNIQESDALRQKCLKLEEEKFKQVKSQTPTPPPLKGTSVSDLGFSDYESMKSSGVGTESSELELDLEILKQFIKLSESIQEIELEIENGSTRVFKNKSMTTSTQASRKLYIGQVQEVVRNEIADCPLNFGGKLCMQGILRHNPFHIIEIENDDADCTLEEQQSPSAELKTYITELEREVEEKNQLLETTERTIKEMREQMTNLESELLEKSIIVERVGDYQRQIECLEKKKLQITMVCEELQEKVKEVTMGESLIRSESTETLSGTINMEITEAEVILSSLQAKLDQEMENLLEKNNLIEKLQDDIRSMTTDKTALEQENYSLQLQLVEQKNKAMADAELITKLREGTADLKKLCHEAEAFKEQCDRQILQLKSELDEKALALQRKVELVAELEMKVEQEAEKQTNKAVIEKLEKQLIEVTEELLNARNQIESNEKQYKNELNRVNLELLEKLELSENEYRKNLQKYNRDWEESRDSYEKKLLEDCELELMKINEQKQKEVSENQLRMERLQAEHGILMVEIQKEKHELESTNEGHKKLVEELQNKLSQFESTESENMKKLKAKCSSLELENDKASVKVQEWRLKYDQQLKDYADLKTEFEQCMATLKSEKSTLESALEDSQIELVNLQKKLETVAELQSANKEMTASLQSLRINFEHQTLQLIAYETLKAEFEKLLVKNEELRKTDQTNKAEKMKVDENFETLQLKYESLRTELDDAKQRMSDYETLVNKHEQNEISLNNMKTITLQFEMNLAELKHNENVNKTALNQLRNEMLQLQEKYESECMKKEELLQECKLLKEQKLEGECGLEKLNKEMLSKINEMQANCDQLKGDNLKLETANAQLNAQLKAASVRSEECEKLLQRFKAEHTDCDTLRESLEKLQTQHNDLKTLMIVTVQEADNSRKELQEKLSKIEISLKESTAEYKAKLQTMEEKTKSLNDTISDLRKQKKDYDDRIAAFESIIKLLEGEVSMSRRKHENPSNDNTSFDSNNSLTSSPLARKSLDRVLSDSKPLNSLNINVDDKLIKKYEMSSVQENERRRNRRLSTHDERRPQSYIPKLCDKGVMTEPTPPENKCECDELKAKVQDYEFKLYLSEGQVKRLRLDLKNHPLKEENASLKKRFEDLKYKTTSEIDRLREKNTNLLNKLNKLSTEAESAEPEKIRVLTNNEAQTESDLEDVYKKLQGKYNDLVTVCRHRYNTIKDLQNKLHLKENPDSGNMNATSYEVGRLKSLETENEQLKKDLKACNKKLEDAKIVLTIRRQDIEQLNAKLGKINDCDSPL